MAKTLMDTLQSDIATAMKAREMAVVTTLRGLLAQIKDATINAGKEVSDEAVVFCVNKAIKQRTESIAQYTEGNRQDLVEKEIFERDLIRKYQPRQFSEDEIEAIVAATISETGLASPKDKGKLMSALMPKVKGKADGRLVNEIVQKLMVAK